LLIGGFDSSDYLCKYHVDFGHSVNGNGRWEGREIRISVFVLLFVLFLGDKKILQLFLYSLRRISQGCRRMGVADGWFDRLVHDLY